jgi:hypothetical protein
VAAIFEDRRPGRQGFEVDRLAAGDAKNCRKLDVVCGGCGKGDRPGGRDRPNPLHVPPERLGADSLARGIPDANPDVVFLSGDRIGDVRRAARARVTRDPDVGAQPPVWAAMTNDKTAHCRSLDLQVAPRGASSWALRLIDVESRPPSPFERDLRLNVRTTKNWTDQFPSPSRRYFYLYRRPAL